MFNLPGSPGVGHRHGQYDAVLAPTPGNNFKEILAGITSSQKRIGLDKCHQVLGEICSMYISISVSRDLFSHMQEALHHVDGKRVALTRGVH